MDLLLHIPRPEAPLPTLSRGVGTLQWHLAGCGTRQCPLGSAWYPSHLCPRCQTSDGKATSCSGLLARSSPCPAHDLNHSHTHPGLPGSAQRLCLSPPGHQPFWDPSAASIPPPPAAPSPSHPSQHSQQLPVHPFHPSTPSSSLSIPAHPTGPTGVHPTPFYPNFPQCLLLPGSVPDLLPSSQVCRRVW